MSYTDFEQLSPFLLKWPKENNSRIYHYCPACEELHPYAVDSALTNGARWSFNGDVLKPSFTPSMRIRSGHFVDGTPPEDCHMCIAEGEYGACGVCHYHVTNGEIKYCSDSTHELAGQTIDLPRIPDKYLS